MGGELNDLALDGLSIDLHGQSLASATSPFATVATRGKTNSVAPIGASEIFLRPRVTQG